MSYLSAEDVLQERLLQYRVGAAKQATALCPFHNEKTASFGVNVDQTSTNYLRWLCRSCGARGNGQTLLTKLLGPGSEGLVESLLPRYHIRQADRVSLRRTESVYLPEAVLELFSGWTLDGLLELGFTQATLDYYEVGYDQWRLAWTYPMRDIYGRLVGVYRRMPDGKAKYLPYGPRDFPPGLVPEDYAFHKSEHLWGLGKELQRVGRVGGPVVLVEGMKACMWVYQWMGDRCLPLAALGLTLSDTQAELLGWPGRPVRVLFDNSPRAKYAAVVAAERIRRAGNPALAMDYAEDVSQPDDLSPAGLAQTLCL